MDDLCDVCGIELLPDEDEVCDICYYELEEERKDS